MIDDFVLPLCERSGDVANRNIVVILSGSTYGYNPDWFEDEDKAWDEWEND